MVSPTEKEIKERVEYFESWLKRLSTSEERSRVTDPVTAKEFIKNSFMKDGSLRNLAQGLEDANTFSPIIEGGYVQELIDENVRFGKLDIAVKKLRRKRVSLQQAIPKRERVVRRKVIRKVMSNQVLRKYDMMRTRDKFGNYRYRNLKGRYVGNQRLLNVADKIIATSAKTRREVEAIMKRDFKGRPKT